MEGVDHSDEPGDGASVYAPARLHMGFLDLEGGLGRRFGSLGLTVEGLGTRVWAYPARALHVEGRHQERVVRCVRALCQALGLPDRVHLVVEETVPAHVGLGSGTQLSLAVGTALARVAGRDVTATDLGRAVERGARSGIGIGAFEQGGFLVDGGRGEGDEPPPVVMRHVFPEWWPVILVLDGQGQGIHGPREKAAFRELPAFPAASVGHVCRLVMMQVLPALVEEDLQAFGAGIGELQRIVGDHFAPAQGGRYSSGAVAEALAWFEDRGAAGVGQSSWGPTGFALMDDPDRAAGLAAEADRLFGAGARLRFMVCRARNRGAVIGPVPLMPSLDRPAAGGRP